MCDGDGCCLSHPHVLLLSVRAQTQTTVPSMRAVYDHIRNIDPVVAAKISPQSATEKEAELHWAITRLLCLDRAFDMLMYVNVIPRIVFEMLKRNFGCGFINDGAKRVLTRHSYSLRR